MMMLEATAEKRPEPAPVRRKIVDVRHRFGLPPWAPCPDCNGEKTIIGPRGLDACPKCAAIAELEYQRQKK